MRKTAIAVIILLAYVAVFLAGRASGITHAIEDSELYTVERYDPSDPSASEWNGYDLRVFIMLDGETYVHGVTQG